MDCLDSAELLGRNIDTAMVGDVARALNGSALPLDRDPSARIVDAWVDQADPHLIRLQWTLFGTTRSYEVRVTDGGFEPDPESIVTQIHWDIVEDVETGVIR